MDPDQYLNTASYGTNDGRTAVGVKAAAEVYFNKDVSDLDLKESALLAGLPQAPSEYNPFLNPHQAKLRRNEVLAQMADQGYVGRAKARHAEADGLGLDAGHKYETIHQPYFFDYVVQELIERYGVQQVREGGLKVYTTINPQLQAYAEQAVADCAACASAALDGARLHRRDQRAHPRDGVVGQLRAVAEQPRGERPPATRLVVQAVRAHHGAQAGDRPEHHLLQRDQPA